MATLYEFKAGRVDLNDTTGLATPLRGQGKVVLKPSSEDASLVAIQWQPRGGYHHLVPSDELVLLPGDVEFEYVPEGKLGRVVMMRLLSSGLRVLYWLQDPSEGDLDFLSSKDEEIILKLNELANQELEEPEDAEEPDQERVEQTEEGTNANDTELADNLHTGHEDATTHNPSTVPATAQTQQERDEDMQVEDETPRLIRQNSSRGDTTNVLQRLSQVVGLSERAAHVATASDSQLNALLQHVPDVAQSRSELVDVVHSPYFSRALDELGQAVLESPALANELGLTDQPRSIQEFIEMLRRLYR